MCSLVCISKHLIAKNVFSSLTQRDFHSLGRLSISNKTLKDVPKPKLNLATRERSNIASSSYCLDLVKLVKYSIELSISVTFICKRTPYLNIYKWEMYVFSENMITKAF